MSTELCMSWKARISAGIAGGENVEEDREPIHRLCPTYAQDINSPLRHVRTRIYFTSESHVHSLINVLRFCQLGEPCIAVLDRRPWTDRGWLHLDCNICTFLCYNIVSWPWARVLDVQYEIYKRAWRTITFRFNIQKTLASLQNSKDPIIGIARWMPLQIHGHKMRLVPTSSYSIWYSRMWDFQSYVCKRDGWQSLECMPI